MKNAFAVWKVIKRRLPHIARKVIHQAMMLHAAKIGVTPQTLKAAGMLIDEGFEVTPRNMRTALSWQSVERRR